MPTDENYVRSHSGTVNEVCRGPRDVTLPELSPQPQSLDRLGDSSADEERNRPSVRLSPFIYQLSPASATQPSSLMSQLLLLLLLPSVTSRASRENGLSLQVLQDHLAQKTIGCQHVRWRISYAQELALLRLSGRACLQPALQRLLLLLLPMRLALHAESLTA